MSSATEIDQKVIAIIAHCLGFEPQQISINSHFEQDLDVDSLDAMDILQAINSQFRLRLTAQHLEQTHTVAELIQLVQEQQQRDRTT